MKSGWRDSGIESYTEAYSGASGQPGALLFLKNFQSPIRLSAEAAFCYALNMKELNEFLKQYEAATNSHDFEKVKPLISEEAVYWFSEGNFIGIESIQNAFEKTWNNIRDEVYMITGLQWLMVTETAAVCIYSFYWKGVVEGLPKEGKGRGTNVLVKNNNHWQIIHEHLSSSKSS